MTLKARCGLSFGHTSLLFTVKGRRTKTVHLKQLQSEIQHRLM